MSATLHMEKLCNVAELNPKFKEKLKSDSSVSFVPMAAVLAEMSTVTGEEKQYCEVSKGYTSFVDGDVLVAKITPCFENGKITQAKLKNRVGFGSTEFHVVRPVEGKLDARYLLHFLRQERIRLEGERKMTGSAGQRRVPANFFASLEIPLLPLPEQKRITDILDRAEALRAKRRAAIAQLDKLLEAVFINIFGNPATNPKGWDLKPFSTEIKSVRYGTSSPPKYVEEGIPFIRATNVKNGTINSKDLKHISKDDAEKLSKCKVNFGNLIVVRSGVNTGDCALVPIEYHGVCAAFDLIVELPLENSIFYNFLINSSYGKKYLAPFTRRAAQAHLNADQLRDLMFIAPPQQLKEKFARIVTAVEKLKATHKASLAELDDLFASLQHRAFRGEL